METKAEIIVVYDYKTTLEYVAAMVRDAGYEVTTARSAEQAVELIRGKHFPLVLSDINLGKWDGLAILPYTKQLERPCAIIFLTGEGSMETAMKAVREGAFDYLSKPFELSEMKDEILPALERALRHVASLEAGADTSVIAVQDASRHLVGKSPAMVGIYRVVAKAALSGGSVLITGESGTGKELIARAIHDNGVRARGPFVPVNCCALTETLLDSELFGHVKGSFTGASTSKVGLFDVAHSGSLFLDEIGDLSPAMQVKLLRALQEGEIKPVGASLSHQVDVRIIAATHRNLKDLIHEGKFREDLYYRLKVFEVELPSLCSRRSDIPELARYFLARFGRKAGKEGLRLSDEAIALLTRYEWPGNVRELEHALERAMSMASASALYPEDFPPEIRFGRRPVAVPPAPLQAPPPAAEKILTLDEMEHLHILKALKATNYNRSRTADLLGIDRTTLYRKAARFEIDLERNHVPPAAAEATA